MSKRQEKQLVIAILLYFLIILWSASHAQEWKVIDTGIEKTVIGNDVWVYKLHQNYVTFDVKGSNLDFKPVTEWVGGSGGAINLNMFVPGEIGAVPEGYTKIEGVVIQPDLVKDWNSFIVWNEDTLMILDRWKDGIEKIKTWPNVSQNIRMIVEEGKRNRWQSEAKKWSVSTLATTTNGDVLFIHSRYPYTMHDFIDLVLAANLEIHRMVYLEGGPESQIAAYGYYSRPVRGWVAEEARHGSYETGFVEHDEINTFWPVPYVLVFNLK